MANITNTYLQLKNSSDLDKELASLALNINRICHSAENEATVVSAFEISLFSFIQKNFNQQVFPIKERALDTERRISKGRIDSKYGAFIIEFKHPSKLKTQFDKDKATGQITDYLNALTKNSQQDYLGLVTDGLISTFVRIENGEIQIEAWSKLSRETLDRIVRAVLALEQVSLTPENLIRDFCEPFDNSLYQQLGNSFYKALVNEPTDKTTMLYQEWKELFKLAHDDETKQKTIEERKIELGKVLNLEVRSNEDEYMMLYSLQTTYAIIVKLIAYKVVNSIHFNKSSIKFNDLATYDSNTIRYQLQLLEDGDIFRQAGILNLLEGDFFSWYCSDNQWNNSFFQLIKRAIEILSKYEDKVLLQEYAQTRDLFKQLYEHIIPSKVRHSLGEFYTPPWLADNLITEALSYLPSKKWRGLDPCAGSGTFVTNLIQRILEEKHSNNEDKLADVLSRVKAIDLNPLAVLTARVNYFVNIAHLISTKDQLQIPVFLGDASYVPEKITISDVDCLKYQIKTIKGYIDIILPLSFVAHEPDFAKVMNNIETDIKAQNVKTIVEKITKLTDPNDLKPAVIEHIEALANKFVELERNGWNGIWARIVTNFLTTANLGRFDLIVGNPPWIDWKNLPAGYRERIKSLCISRHLFSGDRITGGINLNICALISNVSAENWLSENGVLAFLMPENLIFQQTYEGFREFYIQKMEKRLYLQKLIDWTKSGHPFKPVQHRFLSYLYKGDNVNYFDGIDVDRYIKTSRVDMAEINKNEKFKDVLSNFKREKIVAGQTDKSNSTLSYAVDRDELEEFVAISGNCHYIGREGIEFYPQELFLLIPQLDIKAPEGLMYLKNFQNTKSKYNVPQQTVLLEKKYLHPLVKGVDIEKYHLNIDNQFVVPFPYTNEDTRLPLSLEALQKEAPLLTKYLLQHKALLQAQTEYNAKIIGKKNQEFYALARVGRYSFHNIHVGYRDNTKWLSSVVPEVNVEWDNKPKRALFQNHAPTICEGEDGELITLDEAHYIAGILNAPIVVKFITNSSDFRTFKVRPPIYIPKYDASNKLHTEISRLSKQAHQEWDNPSSLVLIEKQISQRYLEIAKNKK
ncbi:N-6 DNA methylase [Patescibacteria group bacterium]|nr:N-6 DNA methylase [Patescibacteria group bacterium]